MTIIGFIISITIIILSLIELFDIWDKSIYIAEPLLGVLMLIQTIENWKTNRSTAYFSLFVAIFIFIITIINLWR